MRDQKCVVLNDKWMIWVIFNSGRMFIKRCIEIGVACVSDDNGLHYIEQWKMYIFFFSFKFFSFFYSEMTEIVFSGIGDIDSKWERKNGVQNVERKRNQRFSQRNRSHKTQRNQSIIRLTYCTFQNVKLNSNKWVAEKRKDTI